MPGLLPALPIIIQSQRRCHRARERRAESPDTILYIYIRKCYVYYVTPRAHCAKYATRGGSFAGGRRKAKSQTHLSHPGRRLRANPVVFALLIIVLRWLIISREARASERANARSHCAVRNYGYSARAPVIINYAPVPPRVQGAGIKRMISHAA